MASGEQRSAVWSNTGGIGGTMSCSKAYSLEAIKDPRSFSGSSSASHNAMMASSQEGAPLHAAAKLGPAEAPPGGIGRNLFIANLTPDVNDDTFQEVFSPFGKILSAKVMLDIHSGRSRGFGFVMYADEDSGREAYQRLHNTPIGAKGQLMQISKAQTSGESAITQTNKLYVRNVPRHVPELELRDHFQQFGELKRFVRKEDTSSAPSPSQGKVDAFPGYVVFLEYASHQEALVAVRGVHGKSPWPGMRVPMMAKTAETAEMRSVRKERQARQRGLGQVPPGAAGRGGKMLAPPYPVQVPNYSTGVLLQQPFNGAYAPYTSGQNMYLSNPAFTQLAPQGMQYQPSFQPAPMQQPYYGQQQFSQQPLYVVDQHGTMMPLSAYGVHSGEFASSSMSYSFEQQARGVTTPPNHNIYPPVTISPQPTDSSLMVHMPPGMRPPGI